MDDDLRVIDAGALAITGDRVAAVGETSALSGWSATRVIDCGGDAVLPGLVDCHNHAFQGLARGLGDGLALWRWLTEIVWPYAGAITPEDAVVSALLVGVEAVRAGTTAILDHHYAPADTSTTIAVADALASVGLRGVVARGMFGPMTDIARSRGLPELLFGRSVDEEIEMTANAMEARPAGRRMAVWPAPINPTYVDPGLLHASVELARSRGTRWHTHCSEVPIDAAVSRRTHGLRPIVWLEREGLLDGATFAHGVWLDDEEIDILGRTRSAVAHCPVANQYLAAGVIRLRDLTRAGVVVGLGTDGPAGGQRQDLFECMKAAVLLQRVSAMDPEAARAQDAIALATWGGARLLGLEAGVLRPGLLADVVVVDLSSPHLQPRHDVAALLAYAARGSDVRVTIVGGEVVAENGRCTRVDQAAIVKEARGRAAALVRRVGLDPTSFV